VRALWLVCLTGPLLGGCGLLLDLDAPSQSLGATDAGPTSFPMDGATRDATRPPEDGSTFPCTSSCDDGNPCNGVEVCAAGACVPGEPVSCPSDGIDCTRDECKPDLGGCVSVPDDMLCPAGGYCDRETGGCQFASGCTDATCLSTPCVTASCNMASGLCEYATFGCSAGEECCAGACVPLGCDDGLECTIDSCHATGGCGHAPRTGACDDGDGDACTIGTCSETACVTVGVRVCTPLGPCWTATCDPSIGTCEDIPLPVGTACGLPDGSTGSCDAFGNCFVVGACAAGWEDCNGDGICECELAPPASVSRNACCPYTGLCFSEVCPSCCAPPA